MRTLYFARLDEQLRLAPAVSVSLLRQLAEACPRLSSAQQSKLVTDIDRFIEARSWTDLALGLVRLELPTWQIRRIACEGGEWICSLSRQPHLPLSLDETADGLHSDLPLAILRALIEALRINEAEPALPVRVPLIGLTSAVRICCDNFV
jgi:hypothetical protein